MRRITDRYALSPQAAVAGGDPYVLHEQGWPPNMGEYVICPEGPATVGQMLDALGRPPDTAVRDIVWGDERNGADGTVIAYGTRGAINLSNYDA
jgi:hypothetical protein